MGRKIFVSYKHSDNAVRRIQHGHTTRAYVDYLVNLFRGDEIYKGERHEDLSAFKRDTIKHRLKDKIHDSSITIVLVSPNMKERRKAESDQWIPWEISYSLKDVVRSGKQSHSNGILAVILPDRNNSYGYYFRENACPYCNYAEIKREAIFRIMFDNMYNIKSPTRQRCRNHHPNHYAGEHSYIPSVKWQDFLSNKNHYLLRAMAIRDNRKSYNITTEIA